MEFKSIRLLLALIIALASFSYDNSQAQVLANVEKGIKVGTGFSYWVGEDAPLGSRQIKATVTTNVAVGIYFEFRVSQLISLQPELIYLKKGTTYKDLPDKHFYRVSYLDVPVLLKLRLAKSRSISPSIYVGPTVSIKLDSKWELRGRGGVNGKLDLGNIKTIDYGLSVGGQLDFVISKYKIFIDVRYTQGLSNITGKEEASISPDGLIMGNNLDLKNRSIYTMLGFGF